MTEAIFRVFRGTGATGALHEYKVPVYEGMVVLDVGSIPSTISKIKRRTI